jgi:phenylalanine-4-hydroxylase
MGGLTTNQSAFIEQARAEGRRFIRQPYELYSAENHRTWGRLYRRMLPLWERHANPRFLAGLANLRLDWDRVPRLEAVNRFLLPLTGFQARGVPGYVPAFEFFDCLRRREFPTTVTIRDGGALDYLPEPDIFHDIAGHVPMHTETAFADALVRFGDCAHAAVDLVANTPDPAERLRRLGGAYRALARFFWFTIEFGLLRTPQGLRVYGSGLLSSAGEIGHSLESPTVERLPVDLERVVNQPFEIDHYQPLLFVIESFDQLFELVGELEEWLRAGRLSDTAPGEPAMSDADIASFLGRIDG